MKLSCALPDCLFVWLIAGHEPCFPTYWLSYLHSWFMLVWGPSHSLEKFLPFWAPDVNNKNSMWNFSFKIRYTEGIINIFNHAFLKVKGEFCEVEGLWPTCCFKGGGRKRTPNSLSCDRFYSKVYTSSVQHYNWAKQCVCTWNDKIQVYTDWITIWLYSRTTDPSKVCIPKVSTQV